MLLELGTLDYVRKVAEVGAGDPSVQRDSARFGERRDVVDGSSKPVFVFSQFFRSIDRKHFRMLIEAPDQPFDNPPLAVIHRFQVGAMMDVLRDHLLQQLNAYAFALTLVKAVPEDKIRFVT
jgi:hypothetical protein